ncbi:MAG: helix-turn-helix domain-containing protein [Clostridia bacterium]|nr:helix-turn-helix domain-containing protein [Clostridia bacterium]
MNISILKQLILFPILFQDVCLELVDVVPADHEAGWEVNMHKHPWFEFNYVQKGAMITNLNGSEYTTSEGKGLLIPPGIPHSNRGIKDQSDHGFCIRFTLKKAETTTNGIYDKLIQVLSSPRASSFPCDVSPLFAYQSLYAVQGSVIHWLFGIYDQWNTDLSFVQQVSTHNISNQVLLYLNEYYPSKIYVYDIAKALNMSYRNLARIFKKETGCSIIEKLTEIRVTKAKHLLLSTNRTMSEIAIAVGFENEYYFSNAFNDYLMQRPSQFRKTHREQ